jgi:arginyl-tRNA synthetase
MTCDILLSEKADRVLYVTDEGQALHFKMIFDAARVSNVAERLKAAELRHVPFGLVLVSTR